jgi:hypothetical protein
MCCCGGRPFNTPTGGIPLGPEISEQFSKEVKVAFEVFGNWWEKQKRPRRSEMPPEVKKALETIKNAEIPGYNGITCKSSCSMMSVEKIFNKNK